MLMMHLPGELDAQLLRDSHLTHFEYEVLSRLSEAQERSLRMSTLATLAGGSLSRLSHVVKRLQDRGWVERNPCPEDRRVTFACLTDAGYDVVVQAAPGYVENVRRLVVDKLTRAQLGELIGIGRRLNDTIERIV
ncbi:MarR family transcriptional regulator [Tomitella gaofuii]|uniref:MarR family winged helix-turn-helix transcriptional regulator n=1 Tax=Tomitella gaofuii TaxID=2760083 RepID=UPI0015FB8D64